jgi:beta-phosphoglucomutase-like phosphatase (HAD superfamily)
VSRGKPEPDLFLEAARRLGVEPRLYAVYEDSAEGLEAARRAGMQGIDIRAFHAPEWASETGAVSIMEPVRSAAVRPAFGVSG